MSNSSRQSFKQASARETPSSDTRLAQLIAQMNPLLSSPTADVLMLDEGTGAFYLQSEIYQKGLDGAQELGRIDMKQEEPLFRQASRTVMRKKQQSVETPAPCGIRWD